MVSCTHIAIRAQRPQFSKANAHTRGGARVCYEDACHRYLVEGSQMPFWVAVTSIYRMALVVSRTQAPYVMCALPHTISTRKNSSEAGTAP